MDVGDPSNFGRIMHIFGQSLPLVSEILSSYSISDQETFDTIARVYHEYNYLADPHGAVGFNSLEKYLRFHPSAKGTFLETAHPVKFPESVEKATGTPIIYPLQVEKIMGREKRSRVIHSEYQSVKDFLATL